MKVRNLVATAGAAALLAPVPAAHAETGRLADFSAAFTTTYPSTPSGLKVHVFLKRADDPDAKPSPLRSAVIRGPEGLRFDTGAMDQCKASDDELRALGSDACPDDTLLTVGSFSAMGGFGPADPVTGDDHVFNGPQQLVEVITVPDGSASPAFDRLTIDGSTLTAHPPAAPGGPPDGETSVRSLDFAIPVRRGVGGRSLITTPPSCPAEGVWRTVATFGFKDGSSDTVSSATPCVRPALKLTVHPRRVRVGQKVRLTFRVRSAAASCASGATIRLAGRSALTGADGRAALKATFHKVGARAVRVTKPGCRAAGAIVRVTRAGRSGAAR
jgi:hypothetical protein